MNNILREARRSRDHACLTLNSFEGVDDCALDSYCIEIINSPINSRCIDLN